MRKVVINEVIVRAGNSLEDQEVVAVAVEAMERERVGKRASLDKYIKLIKATRQAQGSGGSGG